MKFRIDLHVHSRYSGDNDADPEELVEHAIGLNLHGIAFTEHYSYGASEPVERLKDKYRGRIRIFRGVELSAAEGHCLVFGVDTDRLTEPHDPVAEIIAAVSRAGGVVIPSHPYRGGSGIGEMVREVKGICAVEGYNGCNMHAFNAKAIAAARYRGLPFTGGSDAHFRSEVGSCFTEFDDEVSEENLVALLKRGSFRGVDTRKVGGSFAS